MNNIIFQNIQNLNTGWVIVKKHNNNLFFKRKNYTNCVKNIPVRECIFYNKDEAYQTMVNLNSNRKKCLFELKPASEFFVNSWFVSGWDEPFITNKVIPIKKLDKNVDISSTAKVKDAYKQSIADRLSALNNRIPELQKDLEERIENVKSKIQKINQMQQFFNTCEFEQLIKQYETAADKTAKLLYGKG